MSREPITKQQLIDYTRSSAGDRPLENLTVAAALSETLGRLGDEVVSTFVEEARHAGLSWSQIGTSLGMTRQAAQQRSTRPATQAPMGLDGIREKPSPFCAVEDRGGVIYVQVEIDGGWYVLVEVDGHSAEEIVATAKSSFKNRWFKRLSEDLDDVLGALGSELGSTVRVALVDAAGRRHERTVDVTIAKRKAAWRYNQRHG